MYEPEIMAMIAEYVTGDNAKVRADFNSEAEYHDAVKAILSQTILSAIGTVPGVGIDTDAMRASEEWYVREAFAKVTVRQEAERVVALYHNNTTPREWDAEKEKAEWNALTASMESFGTFQNID